MAKKIFFFLLLTITSCNSSKIVFSPRSSIDPIQIASIFTTVTDLADKLSMLTPPTFPEFFAEERAIISNPFPPGVTIPKTDSPTRINFIYPTSSSHTTIEITAVIINHNNLKLLEYQGTILRQYSESKFILQEEPPKDGNLLTGNIMLRETQIFSPDYPINKLTISFSATKDKKFIPISIKVITNYNSGREAFLKMTFETIKGVSLVKKMTRWNQFPEGIILSENFLWNKTLLYHTKKTQGKNFLWVETVTSTSSSNWNWYINNGEIASGNISFSQGRLSFKNGNLTICLNSPVRCNINIQTNKQLTIISKEIFATGKWEIKPFQTHISLQFKDEKGTFNATMDALEGINGIFSMNYSRDLKLTNISPDEKGSGIEYSLLTFSLHWIKYWYSGESSYIAFFHYPSSNLQEITEN